MWNIARRILLLLALGLLFGCGGDDAFTASTGTGDTGGTVDTGGTGGTVDTGGTGGTGTITAGTIALSMVKQSDGTATNVVRKDSPAKVTAHVLDANNSPVGGTIVTFSTSLGVLTPSSGTVLTDASGNATITLGAGDTLGAATLTASATVNSQTVTSSINYQVSAPDVRIGSLSGGTFVEGTLAVAVNPLSAGGTTSVTANLVDSVGGPINFPVTVTFTSVFAGQGTATISSPVTATAGVATSTYTAPSTPSGPDTITATVDGLGLTATASVNFQSLPVGSIAFVKADPKNIALKGMGGIETSVVTFQVKDALGNPIANETVNFALSTTLGGLTHTPLSASSDTNGNVSTTVQAGTVGAAVRVTATLASNPSISTQSEELIVSTGIPDQDSFSLSVQTFNPEAFKIDGVQVPVTIRAADRFNNPVPDGTPIYFTAEGGSINSSCFTASGTCTVNWTSQDPRPSSLGAPDPIAAVSPGGHVFLGGGRATITATTIGEESFNDRDANGVFSDGDEFVDLTEAFRDDNENGLRDSFEPYTDFNSNNNYDLGDGLYNGRLCQHSSLCSGQQTLTVRKNAVIVMSTSDAYIEVSDSTSGIPVNSISVGVKAMKEFNVRVWDLNGNMMPKGTTVAVASSTGTLSGDTSITITNTDSLGPQLLRVFITGGDQPTDGIITVTVTSPSGLITTQYLNVHVL